MMLVTSHSTNIYTFESVDDNVLTDIGTNNNGELSAT